MEKLLSKLTEIEESAKRDKDKKDVAHIRSQCVRILQQISEKLLTEYYIQFGDFKIEPLRLEAYYFHENTFEDCTTYGKPDQKEFDRLFRHGSDVGYEGVDICIGSGDGRKNGDRYLSFLIKDSIVTDKNGESIYCKQTALYNRLVEVDALESSVLQKKEKTEATIFHTVRKGLGGKPFARELLGTLISVEEKQLKNERGENVTLKGINFYDFESGFGAGQTIAEYLRENPEKNNKDNWNSWWDGGFPDWAKCWEKELKKRRGNT